MEKLEPLKEWFVLGAGVMVFFLLAKAAAAGLPDGGLLGSLKKVVLGA